ncbi:gluconokinase [Jeongeupia naejangsanensis]|uniref:Gluconokinase n=1 Tax=Jeongeupia naejangsanensis TaxID=613195 RepID=A0ABS2BHV4_9NEIS|nr:gluconokinase [Jeongeupia naejangsanensis]MBM3114531.1 gluconokinase [Jeongeupia naejangsanensis]
MSGKSYVVMGVSSSGKSSIGAALAQAISAKFIDGDDLHPRANIVKMGSGTPLNDDDRAPWLERINDAVFAVDRKNETAVIVCSALKKAYRDRIRQGNDKLTFVFMEGSYELILERMKARQGHYQKAGMLQSQFDALEVPGADEPDVIHVSIDGDFESVLAQALAAVRAVA